MSDIVQAFILVLVLNVVSVAAGKAAKAPLRGDCHDITSANSTSGDVVEWDPESCWDCSSQSELVGLFFSGLILSIPISTFFMLRKTRVRDLLHTKSQLNI